jgi:hypothetical protein
LAGATRTGGQPAGATKRGADCMMTSLTGATIRRANCRASFMKITIREMMLVILVVAVLLGWLVDHGAAVAKQAARDAAWDKAVESLGLRLIAPREDPPPDEITVETPNGPWRIFKDQHRSLSPDAPR